LSFSRGVCLHVQQFPLPHLLPRQALPLLQQCLQRSLEFHAAAILEPHLPFLGLLRLRLLLHRRLPLLVVPLPLWRCLGPVGCCRAFLGPHLPLLGLLRLRLLLRRLPLLVVPLLLWCCRGPVGCCRAFLEPHLPLLSLLRLRLLLRRLPLLVVPLLLWCCRGSVGCCRAFLEPHLPLLGLLRRCGPRNVRRLPSP
jgi:hypothetical protein